jgi:hypothetical protein
MTGHRSGRPLVPAYLSTGGVARPSRNNLEHLSVLTRGDRPVRAGPPALVQHLIARNRPETR